MNKYRVTLFMSDGRTVTMEESEERMQLLKEVSKEEGWPNWCFQPEGIVGTWVNFSQVCNMVVKEIE